MSAAFCPVCGAREFLRERRPNGDSRCVDGHPYASACAIDEPQKFYTALNHVPDPLRKYARQSGGQWVVGLEPSADFNRIQAGLQDALAIASGEVPMRAEVVETPTASYLRLSPAPQGPVVVAVASHSIAEALGPILRGLGNPQHQGVVVIPFAASALAYAGPDANLFSALVVMVPRSGPITPVQFEGWVQQALVPYLAPNAPRLNL